MSKYLLLLSLFMLGCDTTVFPEKRAQCYIVPNSGPKVRGAICIQLKNGNVQVFTYTGEKLTVHPSRVEWVENDEVSWYTPLNRGKQGD